MLGGSLGLVTAIVLACAGVALVRPSILFGKSFGWRKGLGFLALSGLIVAPLVVAFQGAVFSW